MIIYTNTEFPTLVTSEKPFSSEKPSSNELQDETQNELETKELPGTKPTWLSTANRLSALSSRHSPTLQLIKKLEVCQYKPEEERWPCVKWPDEKAFEDAYFFIQHLDLTSIPVPTITLADDGEVNFLWKYDPVYVDLGFYGTGTYSYFACHKDGRESIGEFILVNRGLLPEVIQLFPE